MMSQRLHSGLTSQREVLPALETMTMTEPRADIDAWGHPGLPQIRHDLANVDETSFHVVLRRTGRDFSLSICMKS